MGNDERKRGGSEAIADRQFVDVGGLDDFGLEIDQSLSEVGTRDCSRIPLANQNRHDLACADVEKVDPIAGYLVEDLIDQQRSRFGNEPLRQRAGVQVKGIHPGYSSRMARMPRLNSLSSGLPPCWSASSRNCLAPIGLIW